MSAKDNKKICSLLEKPGDATVEAAEKAENAKDSTSIKTGKGSTESFKTSRKTDVKKSRT
ncbi:hypothetical protein FY557_09060 [Chryseobacterium sp. SN22]|uniref:hypothetical protein n=1 Tax=Chryseobacterium sp. SN22 TaxID=2606431 RepID=UPI0011EE6873|nr:hypothetical protein [Chryseobacterium sp. SN22]KAA0128403.1 hypothetical protein FY557_09060 [Chryseobacterium sp. SN22]